MSSSNPTAGIFRYTAGLDIGNGYVKGIIEDRAPRAKTAVGTDVVDLPSAGAVITHPNAVPDENSTATAAAAQSDAWFNSIDASFGSPLISDTYRHVLGRGGLSASRGVETFDLIGSRSKAEQELSPVLVLGVLAAKALRDYVLATGTLPGPATPGTVSGSGRTKAAPSVLDVDVVLALALPIAEFSSHRRSYAAAFAGSADEPTVHQVRLNNFVTPVTVNIVFSSVQVVPEGASAQYAINHYGEPLMDKLLADVRSKGLALEGITSADLLAATDTIGVDIGEGTANFPVFTAGEFNTNASRTFAAGYGTVLEEAMVEMDQKQIQHGFTERKSLAELLQSEPNPLRRNFHDKVSREVDERAQFYCNQVAVELSRVLAVVGARTEVIYVYGGGSGPLRERLHQVLMDKVIEVNGTDAAPVLYLDSSYSRGLNREGLILAARVRAERLAKLEAGQ